MGTDWILKIKKNYICKMEILVGLSDLEDYILDFKR